MTNRGKLNPVLRGRCPVCHFEEFHLVSCQLGQSEAENARLQAWVHDLQAGMYINCVYCGHRYGPDDEVPATMADALKEHVEQCPKHPMSALKAERDRLRERLQSWEEGSEPAVAELMGMEDHAQQEWYEPQAAQEHRRERDEAVRQLGDAIWYEEGLRAERDRYKALAERRGEAEKYGKHGILCRYGLLPEGESRQDFSIQEDERLEAVSIKKCTCGLRAAPPDAVCGTCGNQPFEAKEWPEGVTACPDCSGKAGSIAATPDGEEKNE